MSTNSMVAMKSTDGHGYMCIYVHWDGNLSGVGDALLNAFNTTDKVGELISLGDCSSIAGAENISDVESYYADRGEDWKDVEPIHYNTHKEAIAFFANPFNYLWEDGKWSAYDRSGDKLDWNS